MPNAQRNLFRTALLNMEPAHVHDLRRTAATGMRRIGVHPHVVSLVLNHTRQDVTGRHYDRHDGLNEKHDALTRWGAHLEHLEAR
jgi:integrase